jgi:hypothetical protein
VDNVIRSVLCRHGCHEEFGVTLSDRLRFPGVKRVQVPKSQLSELFRRVPGRDNGKLLIELPGRHLIKVIAVIVREDDQVEWRKVLGRASRFDLAPRIDAVTKWCVVSFGKKAGSVRSVNPAYVMRVVAFPMK